MDFAMGIINKRVSNRIDTKSGNLETSQGSITQAFHDDMIDIDMS